MNFIIADLNYNTLFSSNTYQILKLSERRKHFGPGDVRLVLFLLLELIKQEQNGDLDERDAEFARFSVDNVVLNDTLCVCTHRAASTVELYKWVAIRESTFSGLVVKRILNVRLKL